ncbi:MAG: T9SS type A sorting domain-containing protein [Cytophagales bacterium]|nr:T9SS type A sorting domain-containing protein [Cytophagales bacterium]
MRKKQRSKWQLFLLLLLPFSMYGQVQTTSDVYQDAVVGTSGSVTYQANTNTTGVLSFDKSQDYWVNLNSLADDLVDESRSIFMWVKSEENVATDNQVLFAINSSSGGNFVLFQIDNEGDNIEIFDGSTQDASFDMSDQKWHYVGYTYDASSGETIIYIDGLENLRYTNQINIPADAQYSLGQEFDNSNDSDHFNGDMAEISVWKTALSAGEIQLAMQEKLTNAHPSYDDLVGYYSVFQETGDDGSVLKDHSGNGNDGVFENGFSQNYENVQKIDGFNSVGWYDQLSWQKNGVELGTDTTFTTNLETDDYSFIASNQNVVSTDTWSMTVQGSVAVDSLMDETICTNDDIVREIPVNTVNYLDFEETENNWIQINSLSDDLVGKSHSVFMWLNKETNIGSGDINAISAIQSSNASDQALFYIRDSEKLALRDDATRLDGTTELANDTWYFVGYTYDITSGEAKVYVNGEEEASGILDIQVAADWFASLGQEYDANGNSDYFDGKLAEITIWDKSLSVEEITQIQSTAPAYNANNLVSAYGTFPNIADNVLRDLTANGNNGLISHNTIAVTTQEDTLIGYDATVNNVISWVKGSTEFDTDATAEISIEEGTTNYSVTYGTPLFRKSDDFALSYTNLITTQPIVQTGVAGSSASFVVDEVDGGTYNWYEVAEGWTTTTSGQNGFASSNSVFSVYAEGDKVYAGTSEGLSISSDGGLSWITTTKGQNGFANSSGIKSVYADGDKVYVATGNGGISISSDGGLSWVTTTSGQNGFANTNFLNSLYVDGDKVYVTTNSGLSISSDSGLSWITTTEGQNGFANTRFVNSVYADGDKVYAATNGGGLSISSDGGSTWTTVTSGQNGFANSGFVNSVYGEGDKIYAGTSFGLSISTDGGANWTTVTSGQNGFFNSNTVVSVYVEDDMVYAVGAGLLSISLDGGENWNTTERGQNNFPNTTLLFNSVYVANETIYLGTPVGLSILKPSFSLSDNEDTSVDNQIQGATTNELIINNLTIDSDSTEYFVRVTKDGCTQQSNAVTLNVLEAPFVISSTPNNNQGDVAITSNIELTFSELITSGTGNIIIKNATDSSVVETISVASVTISDSTLIIEPSSDLDFATTYFVEIEAGIVNGQISNSPNLAVAEVLRFTTVCPVLISTEPTDQAGVVAGNVTFSVDEVNGATYEWFQEVEGSWITTTSGQNGFASSNLVFSTYAEGNMVYVATEAGVSISSDGGSTWATTTRGENGFANSSFSNVVYVESNVIYVGTSAGLSISEDGGSTWTTSISPNENGFPASVDVRSVYVEDGVIYAGTRVGLFVSENGGSTWASTTSEQNGFANSNAVFSIYVDGNMVYATTGDGLSISEDGGSTWTTTTSEQNGFANSNTVFSIYVDGNMIYAGTNGGGLSISEDGGSTWTTTTSGQNGFASSNTIYSVYAEGNMVYVATEVGLSISEDGGSTWTTTTANQNGFANSDFALSVYAASGVIYAGTLEGLSIFNQYELLSNNEDSSADNQITGATTNELTINNLTLDADSTTYFVVVSKGDCEEISQTVVLNISDAPVLESTIPANDAMDVAVNSNIELTFSETITVGTGNIIIRNADDNSIFETISVADAIIDGKELTIDPVSDFNFGATYIVELEAGIVNGAVGSNLVEEITFTTVNLVVNTNSSEGLSQLEVYPNPVSENVTINLGAVYSSTVIKIVDIHGKTVMEKAIKESATCELNMKDLPSNLYLAIIEADNNQFIVKLVKE